MTIPSLADSTMSLWRRVAAWLQQPEKAAGPLTVAAMLVAFAMVSSPLRPTYELVVSVRLGVAQLPHDARWPQLAGASMLAGIGFTMSLFFAGVAFGTNDALALSVKVGVLAGSLGSAAMGIAFLAVLVARHTKLGECEGQAA